MNRQLGGVQTVFRGPMYQQGYGLGGYFKKFFRWLVPIAEKHVLPHVKSGLENIGKQAIESVSNIAHDTIKGRNIRESAQEHATDAINNIKNQAEKKLRGEGIKKLRGEGIKRKAKKNKRIIFKKSKTEHDIFD